MHSISLHVTIILSTNVLHYEHQQFIAQISCYMELSKKTNRPIKNSLFLFVSQDFFLGYTFYFLFQFLSSTYFFFKLNLLVIFKHEMMKWDVKYGKNIVQTH